MSSKPPLSGFDFSASAAAEATRRPVAALADSLPAGTVIPPHRHRRAQLVYAITGTMTVQAQGTLWVLPPSHALWLPPGVVHEIAIGGPVEMRTLYVEPRLAARLGEVCRVLFVSPLLRELIARAMDLPRLYDRHGSRVMLLILEEIARLPARPLALRMPRDARLARLCRLLLRQLSARASIAELGRAVGLSERSVIRLFPKETGLSFRAWHNQARLLKAFELFDAGRSVTGVALEVGYSTPGAFAKMFRRVMGKRPTQMRAAGRA
jgi:AraC-like DNA-binding protein